MNKWFDIDKIYKQDKHYVEVDLRSMSEGQSSRSSMQICQKLFFTQYHERILIYWQYLWTR